jgi:hypothetical protein
MSKPILIPIRDTTVGVSQAVVIPMPTWTDATSVASFATSIITGAVAVIAFVHPGFTEPSIVQALVPTVSILVAAGAQIVNVLRHSKATVAALSR